jgi:hypothetical protein
LLGEREKDPGENFNFVFVWVLPWKLERIWMVCDFKDREIEDNLSWIVKNLMKLEKSTKAAESCEGEGLRRNGGNRWNCDFFKKTYGKFVEKRNSEEQNLWKFEELLRRIKSEFIVDPPKFKA